MPASVAAEIVLGRNYQDVLTGFTGCAIESIVRPGIPADILLLADTRPGTRFDAWFSECRLEEYNPGE